MARSSRRPRRFGERARPRHLPWLGAGLLLLAFHGALFAERLHDATITDPVVALRWLGAGVLGLAAWRLHRRGAPLLRGRSGLVLALLVTLLHVGAVPPATVGGTEELLVGAPFGVAAALLVTALATKIAARSGPRQTSTPLIDRRSRVRPRDAAALRPALVPRPPPTSRLATV